MSTNEPCDIVDVDLDAMPDRLEDRGRRVHLVVWHRDLLLGIASVPRDQLPLGGAALLEVAEIAALHATWAYLFAPDAELAPTVADAPDLDEVLAIHDPFEEVHRRLQAQSKPSPQSTSPQSSSPQSSSDDDRPRPHDVSLVICTRDRPDDLARLLASLRLLDPAPGEIIVVDNASRTDATRQVAEAAPDAVYVREARPGLDIARNAGVAAACGSIIAFTDDDVEVHPTLIGRLAEAFDRPDVAAVTGQVLPIELETPAQVLFETHWGLGKGCIPRVFGPMFHARFRSQGTPVWEVGAGANMAFRRSVFEAVGSFDERLDVGAAGCSGDSEMWYRILDAGMSIRYAPSAVVRHRHRTRHVDLASQIRAYMRGHTAALLVQYERTGDRGNLVRLFVVLPRYFAQRFVMRVLGGPDPTSAVLGDEVLGSISGVVYYLRHRRGRRSRPAVS